jgi:hypothetical protein
MEYYSDIKKNEVMSFAGKWKNIELGMIVLSEISQTHKGKYSVFSHTQNLDPPIQTNKKT